MTLVLAVSIPLAILAGYLAGSIPFAVMAGHLLKKGDIRNGGSGNAGATNVFRLLGWKAGLAVSIADFLKGLLPVLFLPFAVEWFSKRVLSADMLLFLRIGILAAVVAGHAFPVWAGFRGGKGVACSAGGITAIFPLAAPVCLAVFIATLAVGSYVSVASLVTAWFLPLFYAMVCFFGKTELSPWLLGFFLVLAAGISFLHRKNIRRLIRKEEPKTRFVKE
jgi:glycerol-3-phosphate acyltransferase PlsY